MNRVTDQNGTPIYRNIRRQDNGWGVNVWFGGAFNGLATNIRRYAYATREQAREGDISDFIGRNGRVA